MTVKVHETANEVMQAKLNEFPYFTLRCKLPEVLEERGLTLNELSLLTGIRVASLSELCNLKRSAINVPHLLVIAKVLRITDITDLFEFIMPPDTAEQFKKDQEVIYEERLLPDQEVIVQESRRERAKITAQNKAERQAKKAEEHRKRLELLQTPKYILLTSFTLIPLLEIYQNDIKNLMR